MGWNNILLSFEQITVFISIDQLDDLCKRGGVLKFFLDVILVRIMISIMREVMNESKMEVVKFQSFNAYGGFHVCQISVC